MATKAEILDAIASMTVLELSELIKEMEEKFLLLKLKQKHLVCMQ